MITPELVHDLYVAPLQVGVLASTPRAPLSR